MNKKLQLLILNLFVFSVCTVNSQASPYLKIKGDTLTFGNELISRIFYVGDNGWKTVAIQTGDDGNWVGENNLPDFYFTDTLATSNKVNYTLLEDSGTSNSDIQAQLEVIVNYKNFNVKRTYSVFKDIPVMRTEFAIKGRLPNSRYSEEELRTTGVERTNKGISKRLVMDHLAIPSNHWGIQLVRFKDQTDDYNSLVQSASYMPFWRKLRLEGNLILAENNLDPNQGLAWLKESPLGAMQPNYRGYDFNINSGDWEVVGRELPRQRTFENWTNLYSTLLSLENEGGKQKAIFNLKKALTFNTRYSRPDGDMIMMNTWGDRGQDGKINEKFILEELDVASKLGITHFQIDDGWQKGLTKNSIAVEGQLWEKWSKEDWEVRKDRFPKGLSPIVNKAKALGIELGLWYHPSDYNEYESWKMDADILVNIYKEYGIKYIKIDGMEIPSIKAERNLDLLYQDVQDRTNGEIFFNLDVTAGQRGGYFTLTKYGNIFLENRYTDWGNYYPHWTLRNLWTLSQYVPAQSLQIEFLNKWRSSESYDENDPLAPQKMPFDYCFAITTMAQPLAWMESTGLPEEAMSIAPKIRAYKEVMAEIHNGVIVPIGNEPNGNNWTGFQSVLNNKEGFLLIIREGNDAEEFEFDLTNSTDGGISLKAILGNSNDRTATIRNQKLKFTLPEPFSYVLYKYKMGY